MKGLSAFIQERASLDQELHAKETNLREQLEHGAALESQLAQMHQKLNAGCNDIGNLQRELQEGRAELAAAQSTIEEVQAKVHEVAAEKVR
jgi:septal ring factor EnvC (AmiA/AmiB activator)